MKTRLALPAALALALAGACAAPSQDPAPAPTADPLMAAGEEAGIHNLAEIAPGLFRGSQPEGERAFALLASRGVKVALSVDGARPDIENASKHGIRYVHLPMGYSGIPREEQVRIATVARTAEGGVFVHCHHGKHRGPAASGIAWMARDGSTPEQVVADMRKAGTDPKYLGLYGDVSSFRPITDAEYAGVKPEDLPPVAKVPDFIEGMVRIDDSFERMKAVRSAGWKTPAAMPDVVPAHEARILAEQFREALRFEEVAKRPEDFRGWMAGGEKAAWALEEAIRAGDAEAAKNAMEAVNTSCNSCHGVYRNARKSW